MSHAFDTTTNCEGLRRAGAFVGRWNTATAGCAERGQLGPNCSANLAGFRIRDSGNAKPIPGQRSHWEGDGHIPTAISERRSESRRKKAI